MIYEIVILAAIAAFLGLRLYSVLGQRADHEEEHVPNRFEGQDDTPLPPAMPRLLTNALFPVIASIRSDSLRSKRMAARACCGCAGVAMEIRTGRDTDCGGGWWGRTRRKRWDLSGRGGIRSL